MNALKRWMSGLLALMLVLGLLPVSAAAEEIVPPEIETKVWVNPLYADSTDDEIRPLPVSEDLAPATEITTMEEAAQLLREAMLKREPEVSFDITVPRSEFSGMAEFDKWLDAALEQAWAHTGVPTEGDYLRWQLISYSQGLHCSYDEENWYFGVTFGFGMGTNAEQEAEMDEAVAQLMDQLEPSGSDYEKLCTIYDYITRHVRYDYEHLNDNNYRLKHTAYAALINKTAVCQGYAVLLYRLALEAGIDCRVIVGTSNGCPHAWNIAKVGNRYYNLDATWDEGKTEYDYFLKCEDNFPGHLRDTEYRTVSFHTKHPMTLEDYAAEGTPKPEEPAPGEKPEVSGTCGENAEWALNRNTGTLTISGTGAMTDYTNDYENPQPWKDYLKEIKQVVISEGITYIGSNAFSYCENLTSVSLPDSLEGIGESAFVRCALRKLDLPENLSYLGEWAFSNNTKLTSVVVPKKVTKLLGTFHWCTNLTSVSLPEGLTEIGNRAFSFCNLSSIDIPDTVTDIGFEAFGGNNRLTTVTFPKNVAYLGNNLFMWGEIPVTVSFLGDVPEIAPDAFGIIEATVYYPADNPTWTEDVRQKYGGKKVTWKPYAEGGIASGICGDNMTWSLGGDGKLTISGEGDMYDYGYKMEAGNDAPWYGYHQFISSVEIEEGVRKIGSLAFAECIAMKTAVIPDTVEEIGVYAFFACESLDTITLPESVKALSYKMFYDCKNLKEVVLSPNLTEIPDACFAYCPNLKRVEIPEGVKRIGKNAFHQCHALEEVILPQGLEVIDEIAFAVCMSLKNVTLPDSLTTLGRDAFATCESMTNVTIPDGVTEIPFEAFTNCRGLLSITLGKNTRIIDTWAFDGCSSLTSISVPATVTTIGLGAFRNCTALKAINFEGHAPEFSRLTLEDTYAEESDAFLTVTAAAYYPANDPSWTADIRQNYGGTITWVVKEESHAHSYTEAVTAPTCTQQGYTTYTCECGDSYVGDYVAAQGHSIGGWHSNETEHWHICSACGETLDAAGHDGTVCSVCGYETPGDDSHEFSLGDVNHDSKINAKDATLILQKSVGVLKDSAKFCEDCAEVSGDGKLNAKDSTLILQFSVGLRDSFPAQK